MLSSDFRLFLRAGTIPARPCSKCTRTVSLARVCAPISITDRGTSRESENMTDNILTFWRFNSYVIMSGNVGTRAVLWDARKEAVMVRWAWLWRCLCQGVAAFFLITFSYILKLLQSYYGGKNFCISAITWKCNKWDLGLISPIRVNLLILRRFYP